MKIIFSDFAEQELSDAVQYFETAFYTSSLTK